MRTFFFILSATKYANGSALTKHKQYNHNTGILFYCDQCETTFETKGILNLMLEFTAAKNHLNEEKDVKRDTELAIHVQVIKIQLYLLPQNFSAKYTKEQSHKTSQGN